jgi:hypothetical protein
MSHFSPGRLPSLLAWNLLEALTHLIEPTVLPGHRLDEAQPLRPVPKGLFSGMIDMPAAIWAHTVAFDYDRVQRHLARRRYLPLTQPAFLGLQLSDTHFRPQLHFCPFNSTMPVNMVAS